MLAFVNKPKTLSAIEENFEAFRVFCQHYYEGYSKYSTKVYTPAR